MLNFSKTSNGFQFEPSDEDDRAEFRRRRAGGDRLRTGDLERRPGLRRRPPAPPPRRGERDLKMKFKVCSKRKAFVLIN